MAKDYGTNPFMKQARQRPAFVPKQNSAPPPSKPKSHQKQKWLSYSLNPGLPLFLLGGVVFLLLKAFVFHGIDRSMVQIEGGCFRMGSPGKYSMALPAERPQHEVCLDDFQLDPTEVTQAEYTQQTGKNPSFFKNCPQCPVERVTWQEAFDYCQSQGKRLPTEAEWEYAARAKTQTQYFWGDNMQRDHVWYSGNSEGKTHPVRTTLSNAWGLYDMSGNVWEWVQDWADNQFYKQSPHQNPQGPDQGTDKVLRGGSYNAKPRNLRSAARGWAHPQMRQNYFGFRCAK